MTHTYQISGMTCSGCASKVQGLLSKIQGVESVQVHLELGEAEISMNHHIPTTSFQAALKDYPKYLLTEKVKVEVKPQIHITSLSWIETYKPVLLIFFYVSVVSALVSISRSGFNSMRFMQAFMAGFFLVFSFFKLLDLKGFVASYAMYDIIAKRVAIWGYAYAFIEFLLGVAYLTNFYPIVTNAVTLVVMGVSLIGVLQSVLDKKKIQCACLGAIFNLPMSTITIVEDGLMIIMSGLMITYLL